jgi:hypothetical protein
MGASPENPLSVVRALVQLLGSVLDDRPPAAAAETDWPELLRLAQRQGVAAYLYPSLVGAPPNHRPPATVLNDWRLVFLAAAADAARREAQAQELLAALSRAHVDAVPLKGLWLAAAIYDDSARRHMTDLDVLVPPDDLPRARDALQPLGYVVLGGAPAMDRDIDQTLVSARQPLPLELHWHLGIGHQPPLHRPELSGLWQRLESGVLYGAPVRLLRPEEHLIYLAYHILHHRFAVPLRSYLDLVLLARTLAGRCDRRQLDAIVAEWGLTQAAPRVLGLAWELFAQPPPAWLADWMPAAEQPLRAAAVGTILTGVAQPALPAERTLLAFRARHPLARLALIVERVFRPRNELLRTYPCARFRAGLPLAYALRVRDLLRQYSASVRRVLRREREVTSQLDRAAAREALVRWTLSAEAPPPAPGPARRSA